MSERPGPERNETGRSADSPLDNLLARLVDEQTTAAEIAALESILARDPAARRRYVRYLDLHQELRRRAQLGRLLPDSQRPAAPPGAAPQSGAPLGTASHGLAPPSTPVMLPTSMLPPGMASALSSVTGLWSRCAAAWAGGSPRMRAVVMASALSLYFAGLLILVAVHRARQVPPVAERGVEASASIARLLEPVGCVWKAAAPVQADSARPDSAQPDSNVVAGEVLELVTGVARFRFHNGVDVTAVGPCALKFISPGRLRMEHGRLVARVPRQAIGFTVEAERVEIVDLGTEFGVEVDERGQAEVHMLEGAAEVRPRIVADGGGNSPQAHQPDGDTAPAGDSVRLTAGQAVRVSEAGTISSIDSDRGRFAGAAENKAKAEALGNKDRLDVVDLLCGGAGTGRNRGLAIDPATGKFGTLPFTSRNTDGQYHPTPNHRVLDGCFMPDGTMQIDSAGHRFEFPKTCGYAYDLIRAGGEVTGTEAGQVASKLGEVDFGEPPHGFLMLQPNAGLTLDLASIRRGRKQRIRGFRAIVGNSDIADRTPKADFFVIVDGKVRFERRGFTVKDTPFNVYVSLDGSDGFLTLAATDGGDRTGGDWIGLGDPVLELRDP